MGTTFVTSKVDATVTLEDEVTYVTMTGVNVAIIRYSIKCSFIHACRHPSIYKREGRM